MALYHFLTVPLFFIKSGTVLKMGKNVTLTDEEDLYVAL